ncbi:MAG: hypothetical protein IJJ06_09155 [Mogibacterium sp.]|nr:hypothetical protein [Mogibacterium sp.]MBR0342483.1 hypothetical protein [Oscillospiraceae bacterium]
MPKKHHNEWSAWKDSLGSRQAEQESLYEKWQPKTYSVKEWIKYRFSREGVDVLFVADRIEDLVDLIKTIFVFIK